MLSFWLQPINLPGCKELWEPVYQRQPKRVAEVAFIDVFILVSDLVFLGQEGRPSSMDKPANRLLMEFPFISSSNNHPACWAFPRSSLCQGGERASGRCGQYSSASGASFSLVVHL